VSSQLLLSEGTGNCLSRLAVTNGTREGILTFDGSSPRSYVLGTDASARSFVYPRTCAEAVRNE
jgi:hypothetical protein